MTIQNGRLFGDRLSLDEQGFVFVPHLTQVADFSTREQLKSVYYPEVERLIRRESGASHVVIFDHTLRSGDETERETKTHPRARAARRTTTTRSGRTQSGAGNSSR